MKSHTTKRKIFCPKDKDDKTDYLEMYEQLRTAHRIIKSLLEISPDTLMNTALEAVHSSLYMAEHRTMELYE